MQMISVVVKLQAFGRRIIQRKADDFKLKAICMIQPIKKFFKNRSGIISLQSFAKLIIVMAQLIVRNDAARKIQMFCKLPLFLIDKNNIKEVRGV